MIQKSVMSGEDMRRAINRIAHEILEKNRGASDLVFIGLRTRGAPLAQRLAKLIKELESTSVAVGALDISLYRDDILSLEVKPIVQSTTIPVDIHDKNVILVDDVLYTGRSIRAAMDAIMDLGRPKTIQLAVLVDRGHRELPIRADYAGKNIPSSQSEQIQVLFLETDGRDEVIITS